MNPITEAELRALLAANTSIFPELKAARDNLATLRATPAARQLLESTASHLSDSDSIPQTKYSAYRRYQSDGDRTEYEIPYFEKRAVLSAAALRLFLGQTEYLPAVQDYIWNICEEMNWVVPAHEWVPIDLFAAETGFLLGEALLLLGETLDEEVRIRARDEIERRILTPYLRDYRSYSWYNGHHNWNSVCNSAVGATFLLLESDPDRQAHAVALVLNGLEVYLQYAFEEDGASTEGVAYWHYGLHNLIAFSEMLRARTSGALDLLTGEKMKRIAAYPAKMHLSGNEFAAFSDCDPHLFFYPGILTRFAQRTAEDSLLGLVAPPGETMKRPYFRLPMLLRDLLWWNGEAATAAPVGDTVLPNAEVVRLTSSTPDGAAVILMAKAGHNAEHHNQNDVGSFIFHVGDETLLCDPGRGLYTRQYFSDQRYKNIFANSFGHSVPRIGGKLQSAGREYCGALGAVQTDAIPKSLAMEISRAYPLENLSRLTRVLALDEGGAVSFDDEWEFFTAPLEFEEAFMTWHEATVSGHTATIHGMRHALQLRIQEPADATFHLQLLKEESRANHKSEVLKRLSFVVPAQATSRARVTMKVLAQPLDAERPESRPKS